MVALASDSAVHEDTRPDNTTVTILIIVSVIWGADHDQIF